LNRHCLIVPGPLTLAGIWPLTSVKCSFTLPAAQPATGARVGMRLAPAPALAHARSGDLPSVWW